MLYGVKTLEKYSLCSLDGAIGRVREFYFDDRFWTVRYLVADTGKWLKDRRVLISPKAMEGIDKTEECISLNLTKRQIEESPHPESDKPVSRQFEEDYHRFFSWPTYYAESDMWGASSVMMPVEDKEEERSRKRKSWDPELRSTHDVTGYSIIAADGEVGCIDDFIIDDETWAIRYLVVDTQSWWPGKKILVAPQWICNINWGDSRIFVDLNREPFKSMKEYSAEALLTREYETSLYLACNRKGYWVK